VKNTDAQSSATQTVTAERQYDAFGNILGSSGSWQGQLGYGGAFGYQEEPTGFRMLGFRHYDSSTGRFLSRDPIKDGRNWYVYCDSDPVNAADPDGLQLILIRPMPPGVNVRNNVREVYRLWHIGHTLLFAWISADNEMYNRVRNGGIWDYKQIDRKYEAFGNFHYGIVMAAYNIQEEDALRGAG
jgi:RHS repeat-associated protein